MAPLHSPSQESQALSSEPSLRTFLSSTAKKTTSGLQSIYDYPETATDGTWNQAVVSWNFIPENGVQAEIEVRVKTAGGESRWYQMGAWALDGKVGFRRSIKGQSDAIATVDTDTLILKVPATGYEIRVISNGNLPPKSVSISLSNSQTAIADVSPFQEAWGKLLDVKKRAQGNYPNGGVLCSPTSTSMLLSYWSEQLGKPELDHDVPDVVQGVFDPNWGGTGNWPFNMAYAGSQPGLRAIVGRFSDINQIERLVAAGYPVATSIAYGFLKGLGHHTGDDGHLVVIVGFDSEGNPIFNDPGIHEVRKTYKRADFLAAWNDSHGTVYLVFPEENPMPLNKIGLNYHLDR